MHFYSELKDTKKIDKNQAKKKAHTKQSAEQGNHTVSCSCYHLIHNTSGILWKTALKSRGAQKNWQVFTDNVLQGQE